MPTQTVCVLRTWHWQSQ